MVFRLPPLSSLWVPFTILLFAASLSNSEVSEHIDKSQWNDGSVEPTNATKRNLTGIPQIDYLTDPNLPRELNGYNLSDYPFLNKVPTNNSFKCDGLKDGFYASIEYKCQLYHHCLYGTRYDFLCANYTAFDQRTFICQFVSDVDCPNSALFFHRNDALYWENSTTPAPISLDLYNTRGRVSRTRVTHTLFNKNRGETADLPATNQEATPAVKQSNRDREYDRPRNEKPVDDDLDADYYRGRPLRRLRPGRRRPARRRRPRPRPYYDDYYDDDEDYVDDSYARRPLRRDRFDDYYYEGDADELPQRKLNRMKNRRRQYQQDDKDPIEDNISPKVSKVATAAINDASSSSSISSTTEAELPPLDTVVMAKTREELFTQSRAPPKIKPPVPITERRKYNEMQGRVLLSQPSKQSNKQQENKPTPLPANEQTNSRKKVPQKPTEPAVVTPEIEQYDQQYYDDDYEQSPTPVKKSNKFATTTSTTTTTTTPRPTARRTPTTTTSTSTTTTQSPPAYDYEYEEYDDELPQQQQPQQQKIPLTTTSTTTTTTPRPTSNRKYRSRQKQDEDLVTLDTTQTDDEKYISSSTPGFKSIQINNEDLEPQTKLPSSRQASSRSRSSSFYSKSNSIPKTSPPTTTSTSERSFGRTDDRYPAYDASYIQKSEKPEATTTQKSTRPSRFWQRQPKAQPVATTTTTTTTPAPDTAEDYAYYDDLPLTRYGQRAATTYSQYPPSTSTQYIQDSPAIQQQQEQQPQQQNGVILNYQQQQQQEDEPQIDMFRTSSINSNSNNNNNNHRYQNVEQSNYVTPFRVVPPKTTTATYLQYHQPQQQQQQQPEFISLVDDEDESYYPTSSDGNSGSSHIMSTVMSPLAQSQSQSLQQQQESLPNQSRFRNQITRMFTAPQELYPIYTTPPQYIKQVRPRSIIPMFLPFSTF